MDEQVNLRLLFEQGGSSFIHLHPSSERNVLIHLEMNELLNELRWQDVLIHLKMDELAQKMLTHPSSPCSGPWLYHIEAG
jgi:hypothetical protein